MGAADAQQPPPKESHFNSHPDVIEISGNTRRTSAHVAAQTPQFPFQVLMGLCGIATF